MKATERRGIRGFDAHKRIEGRRRRVAVDTLAVPFSGRVEPARVSDRGAGFRRAGGLRFAFPEPRTLTADAGHGSRKPARALKQQDGYELQIAKRRHRALKITGLTWIAGRSIAWPDRSRRLPTDYEDRARSSERMVELAAIRFMLNRLAPA